MEECITGRTSVQSDEDPVTGSDPVILSDRPFCLPLHIYDQVMPAQMLSGIRLEDDRLSPAMAALHVQITFYPVWHKIRMAMPISADQVRALHQYELRILLSLEHLMKRHEWVPLDLLKSSTGFSEGELSYRLGRLMSWDLVRYNKVPYEGYSLVFNGLDTLALRSLADRDTVKAMGSLIGVGKESVVYEGLGLTPLVLKFHRLGQRSFQSARITRGYFPSEGHLPRLFASILSAEREFLALKTLHPRVQVPLPIDRNRHVVVMSYIRGPPLIRAILADPEKILEQILENVRNAYLRGIIHADLSEYNIMVEDGLCYLIDWPQWVETTHPNAQVLLRRDVGNLLTYFQRKYSIGKSLEETVAEVTG